MFQIIRENILFQITFSEKNRKALSNFPIYLDLFSLVVGQLGKLITTPDNNVPDETSIFAILRESGKIR